MAKNKSYQEKSNPFLSLLYIILVLALVAANVFMYMNWRNKQSEYNEIVRQAAETEYSYNIENRKTDQVVNSAEDRGD